MLRERQRQALSTFVRAKRARLGLLCVATLGLIYFFSTFYFVNTVANAPSALESCQPWPECGDAFREELHDTLRNELPDCAFESNCETLADKLATLSMSLEKELASASVQDLETFLRMHSTKNFLARLEGRNSPKVDPRRKPLVCTRGDTEIPFHMPALVTEERLPSTIPRQLFFSGRTRVINRPLCENFQRIQYLNPEYDIYFFDDDEVNRFIDKSEFAAIRPLLDTILTGAIRGDIWRYLVLLKFGGVYCDMDARWEGHLRDFIPRDVEIVSAGMPDGALSQWFMVFAPGHQIMAKAAEISLSRLVGLLCKGPEAQWEYKEKKFISGPPVLQEAFLQGLPVLSSEQNHVEKDKMLYFLSQNVNGFLTHNYEKVKESTKRQSIHWRNQGQSVLRPDLNRAAFTSPVCTEWKRVIKSMFERYLQFERRPNVTSVVDLLRS